MKITKLIRMLWVSLMVITFSSPSIAQVKPVIQKAKYYRKTVPLRDMEIIHPGPKDRSWKDGIIRNEENPKVHRERKQGALPEGNDPLWQDSQGKTINARAAILNFDGVGNVNNVYPPDTDGDVGPDHYFQMINLSFAIWDKDGEQLYGPVANSTLWNGFIGPWTGTNDGDPIVLYDEQADQWLTSQFAINTSNGTYWQLIAISETGDPLGSYYQYAFQFPAFNDYPKFGIWHDGYYASFNMFGSYFRGAAAAFDRDKMLEGDSTAVMVLFDMPEGSDAANMLPADLDGTPAPSGTPNYFVYFNDDAWGYENDQLRLWKFDVDWETPENSVFEEITALETEAFDSQLCGAPRWRCIPQPNTGTKLESISDRLMFRLQYRNFGTYQVMLTNHTVDVSDGHAGVRWYEMRNDNDGNGWYIYQQGTYAPDANHRWMGSIAMNGQGDIALGYTVSSDSIHPSVRYTGRTPDATLGEMNIAEIELMRGFSSQTNINRWGDYSCMSVDPANDSTFWYTQEYMGSGWKTRISSFNFEPVPNATADAGPDSITCENSIFTTNGSAAFYNSVRWESDGDGIFGNTNALEAPYWRGQQDLENGSVMLRMTAYGYNPGQTAKDSMLLEFMYDPQPYAGEDTLICQNEVLELYGSVMYSDSIWWTSSGDGLFSSDTSLFTVYTPGEEDIAEGEVELVLNAKAKLPCETGKSDQLTLTIDECTSIGTLSAASAEARIIPNPNSGVFTLQIIPDNCPKLEISIISFEGKRIYSASYSAVNSIISEEIDLRDQPKGTYILELKCGSETSAEKFIIE